MVPEAPASNKVHLDVAHYRLEPIRNSSLPVAIYYAEIAPEDRPRKRPELRHLYGVSVARLRESLLVSSGKAGRSVDP